MRIFLTKVWGFDPEEYPVLGFNREWGRRKFLRESGPEDWLVLAGTRLAPTPREKRGRLLGRVQLGTQEVSVEEILRSVDTEIPAEHYLHGRYRWPYGLPMIAAYRFPNLPDLAAVFGNYLPGRQWASYAIDLEEALGSEAVKRIEALPEEPAHILEIPAIKRQRERQRALARNRRKGPTGPAPSDHREGSFRSPSSAAAYLLKLEGGRENVFKVGYSGELDSRLTTLNKGLLSRVTGFSWRMVAKQNFGSERQAYAFEQEVHRRLRKYLADQELEIYFISQQEIELVWRDVFFAADWAIGRDE
jgi:T5orf172 domain-containing protein